MSFAASPAASPVREAPTLAERLSAPPKDKPGKRCGDALPKKAASPEMPHGKKTYQALKPNTGFVAYGGGHTGKPRDVDPVTGEVAAPSPTRFKIKVSGVNNKPEAARIVGPEDKLMASAERVREMQGHPKGKKPGSHEAIASSFTSAGYLDETESSARRRAKVISERMEFPARPRQQNPWEKKNNDAIRAKNIHLGHGIGVTKAIHGASPSGDDLTAEEISRCNHTGAAGSPSNSSPVVDDAPDGKHNGKKQPALAARAVDHVYAEAFNTDPSPDRPHIPPPLDFSKLNFGKKQKISYEKKSPQAQRRIENACSVGQVQKKKNAHLQFSARRVHATHGPNALLKGYGSMTAVVSARNATRGSGRNNVMNAVARKQTINFRDPNAMDIPPPRPGKTISLANKASSFDNDFARANNTRGSASPDQVHSPTAQNLLKHENRPGRRLKVEQKNSSLKGILNPETPRKRKALTSSVPFGTHQGQDLMLKKSASPARIGWHQAAATV